MDDREAHLKYKGAYVALWSETNAKRIGLRSGPGVGEAFSSAFADSLTLKDGKLVSTTVGDAYDEIASRRAAKEHPYLFEGDDSPTDKKFGGYTKAELSTITDPRVLLSVGNGTHVKPGTKGK